MKLKVKEVGLLKEMDETELYEKFEKEWGFISQVNLSIQECAELICAFTEIIRRNKPNVKSDSAIIDITKLQREIADVEIMIAQIKYSLRIKDKDIEIAKRIKLLRTFERWRSCQAARRMMEWAE